jgi:hypothetical protein
MIRLSRRELLEMATVYVVANTPRSLFQGLLHCQAVDRMRREASPEELLAYYDHITARADRSEIVMGLAYGVLMGNVLNTNNRRGHVRIDASRLSWGQHIEQIAQSINPSTQILSVTGEPLTAHIEQIRIENQPSNALIVSAGPDTPNWEPS